MLQYLNNMIENWTMNGLPWTKAKMKKAVETLKPNATITFVFGIEKPSLLKDLNEIVFGVRPDFVLHIWTYANNKIITSDELKALIEMNNVKKLHFNSFHATSLPISEMTQLVSLQLYTDKKLDISFIEKLNLLTDISLKGSFLDLQPLSSCKKLETLLLSTTITSFDFFEPINKIEKLTIDSCISTNDFSPFNKPTLKELTISSIKMLENVDTLADFEHLNSLRIDASKIEILPKLTKLRNLKKLHLDLMKRWTNPEVLQTLPLIEELTLSEINTKLKAEQFYFLTEMETLNILDFRFMDFNKKRIEKLNQRFKERNKDSILRK